MVANTRRTTPERPTLKLRLSPFFPSFSEVESAQMVSFNCDSCGDVLTKVCKDHGTCFFGFSRQRQGKIKNHAMRVSEPVMRLHRY